MGGMFDEDPFLVTAPPVPAPEGKGQRLVKSGVYGATLGFFPQQFKPEGVGETVAEIAGSIPTYAAASALGAGPAAAGIRAATGLRAGYAAGSAAVAAGLGAVTEGGKAAISGEENPLIAATRGAATQGLLEYGGVKAYAKFTKAGRAAAAAEKAEFAGGAKLPTGPAATVKANELVKASAETPSPAAVDIVTTKVPDTPTIKLMNPPEGAATFPTTPREFTAAYGPKIDADSHVSGLPKIETDPDLIEKARGLFRAGEQINVAKIQVQMGLDDAKARAVVNALKTGISQGRVRLDHFVDSPTVWTPSGIPSHGWSDIAVRTELDRRFTPDIVRSAETMSEEEFTKYAIQDPVAREIIKAGKSDPLSVWTLAQSYKGGGGPGGGSFYPVGKNPMFTETFDETLGKKVLVPLNEEAGGWVDALKMSSSPRHLELQLGMDQIQYFKSPKGIKTLAEADVIARNEPFLTSNILKQSDEAIERIFHETPPINITQPSIIQKTGVGKTVDDLRATVATGAKRTEQEIDEIYAAAERDVDAQLEALRTTKPPRGQAPPHLMVSLTSKEKAMMDSILKRCR